MQNKYLIFGTGSGCESFLFNANEKDFDSILGFVDNNKEKQGTTFKGKKVYSPEEILNFEFNKIIIASLFYKEIETQLLNLGIKREKIIDSIKTFSCSNFEQLCFLDEKRKYLKNKEFTIISNYCWGSFLYRFLHLPYNSPFVGTMFDILNYSKLLGNLEYYLNQPLTFDIEAKLPYLYGKLDDVFIHFVHYKDPVKTVETWNRRLKRINFDNLFIHWGSFFNTEVKLEFLEQYNFENKITIIKNKSLVYSAKNKFIISDPVDLIAWFNKEL